MNSSINHVSILCLLITLCGCAYTANNIYDYGHEIIVDNKTSSRIVVITTASDGIRKETDVYANTKKSVFYYTMAHQTTKKIDLVIRFSGGEKRHQVIFDQEKPKRLGNLWRVYNINFTGK